MLGSTMLTVLHVPQELLVFCEFCTNHCLSVVTSWSTIWFHWQLFLLHQGIYFHHFSQWLLQRIHIKDHRVQWVLMELRTRNQSHRQYFERAILKRPKEQILIVFHCLLVPLWHIYRGSLQLLEDKRIVGTMPMDRGDTDLPWSITEAW